MNKYKGTTKISLTIRIVVGGYLIYTAMSLFKGISQSVGTEKIVFILFSVLFTAIGALLIFISGKALINKEYDDGSADDNNEAEEDEDRVIESNAESMDNQLMENDDENRE